MVDATGFDAKDFKRRMYTAFGPDSDYEVDDVVRKDQLPISGPWRPGHLKAFVANFEDNEEITGSLDGPNVSVYIFWLVIFVSEYFCTGECSRENSSFGGALCWKT